MVGCCFDCGLGYQQSRMQRTSSSKPYRAFAGTETPLCGKQAARISHFRIAHCEDTTGRLEDFCSSEFGWIDRLEEGCIDGFSAEVNFCLRNSFFVNETQEGCSRRRSDVAIPAIPVNSSPSPRSPSTATTTTVGELPPRCKRRTSSPES